MQKEEKQIRDFHDIETLPEIKLFRCRCGVDVCKCVFPSNFVAVDRQVFNPRLLEDALQSEIAKYGNQELFNEERHGHSHPIIGRENLKYFEEKSNTMKVLKHVISCRYGMDILESRVNKYSTGEVKPAHQDAAAVLDSKASEVKFENH